ncbi:SMI1/KNR4 family protein [Chryseobacterium sp.]|uniref:SMI1/KNR4 family protein n=1 Tax=Chryseobacterium sp. TaxID=1871047 RepID=UPI002619EA9D|nr:SMI1/KNR4 family protein [Chryseobacterium sp.]
MNNLTDLEQKYNFQYPEIYRRLSENKMLDWGESSSDWYKTVFPKLKENPPLLLFGYDIEIWNNHQLVEGSIQEMSDEDDYRNIHSDYKFVPFAKNGAGDWYAFQFDIQNNGEVPVTFIPHDDVEAEVMAGNFQDFIFRQLLEAVTEIDDDSMFYEDEEADLKENLLNQLKTHEPYLNPKQIDILKDIYQRDIFEYTYKVPNGHTFEAEGLVTFDEVEEILAREIAFEQLNKKFNYTECWGS